MFLRYVFYLPPGKKAHTLSPARREALQAVKNRHILAAQAEPLI